jgi:hypothetical protein
MEILIRRSRWVFIKCNWMPRANLQAGYRSTNSRDFSCFYRDARFAGSLPGFRCCVLFWLAAPV